MGDLSLNFSRHEFACNDKCGRDTVDFETLQVLEDVREHFNQPVTITSGYRCEARNRAVGGASDSQHVRGRACDIKVAGVKPADVYDYLDKKYSGKYGFGKYSTFTHVDTRSNGPARWTG